MYSYLMYSLRLLKMFHDIGIFEKAVGDIEKIDEDDYYELALRGLEHVAPIFEAEDLGEDVCCGGHVMYHFSDPAIPEFSRLCRLYEHKHGITPKENPHMKKVDDCYNHYFHFTGGYFATGYDNEIHPREIWIETCPEHPAVEHELIELVYNVLESFRTELEALRAELLCGPIVYLPALPAHQKAKRTRKKPRNAAADRRLKKAS